MIFSYLYQPKQLCYQKIMDKRLKIIFIQVDWVRQF